jgi:hypothetical protein
MEALSCTLIMLNNNTPAPFAAPRMVRRIHMYCLGACGFVSTSQQGLPLGPAPRVAGGVVSTLKLTFI